MKAESKLSRLVMVSPWFLLIFLAIPLFVILNVVFHARLPLMGTTQLLVNNGCFAFLIALRFLRYLLGIRKAVRYGAAYGMPRHSVALTLPAAAIRGELERAGYTFSGGGSYGEKRDLGYLGTTILYGGLLIVLFTGTLDNLLQFSGTLLDGMGPATKLSRPESYRSLVMGPLAARPDSLPRMQIMDQLMPDKTHPHGATDIALIFQDGSVQRKIVKPLEPFRCGDYDIIMARFIIEPQIVIRTRDSKPVFNGLITLMPVVRKEGAYGYYAPFKASGMDGLVYYRSDKNRLKVLLKRGDTWVFDAEMTFQVDQEVQKGDYILSCEKMGKWTEIHVVRRRHMAILVVGGIVAVIGLFMRIMLRPQRVWLEEAPEGCRARAVGGVTRRLLRDEG